MSMINSISLVESLLLTVMICSEIYVTITDIKRGIIENKILLIAGSIGLVANIVYYTIYAHTFIAAFLLNVITMSVISVAFYLLHILFLPVFIMRGIILWQQLLL